MPTNRDWLFSLPLEEQLAWMNAEHVEGVEIQGEVCDFEHEPDSREKLEADIHSWLTSQVAVSVYVNEIEAEVRKWLDRQAAITWWEHTVGERNPYYPMLYEQLEYANGRIVELEADLAESRRDTESYRKKLSRAVDNAHDTCMLMDEGFA